jgi:phosphatidylinositol alpha-1,6-mannosyltransferase
VLPPTSTGFFMSRESQEVRELVHVSASLREDGGGAAHFGRLLGRASRRFASRHGLRFRGHLPDSDGGAVLDGYRSFGGSFLRLAGALAALQLRSPARRALLFDHPGPARIQGWLPASTRSRFTVAILGIDVWRPLTGDRARSLARAHSLLAISRTTAKRAEAFLPGGCTIDCVHPGIEVSAAGEEAERQLLADAGGYVLVVSRLDRSERYKGHDELLDAWPELQRGVPSARLLIAGEGDDRPRLEARARELGLEASVTFTGAVDAATRAALYRQAAVFAMPSRDEGFGLVFVEAMAAGIPCVALAETAPAEIIVSGETGILVRQQDRAALTAALGQLLTEPQRAHAMGQAGRARFEAEFTADAFEKRLEPVLERLVSHRG